MPINYALQIAKPTIKITNKNNIGQAKVTTNKQKIELRISIISNQFFDYQS